MGHVASDSKNEDMDMTLTQDCIGYPKTQLKNGRPKCMKRLPDNLRKRFEWTDTESNNVPQELCWNGRPKYTRNTLCDDLKSEDMVTTRCRACIGYPKTQSKKWKAKVHEGERCPTISEANRVCDNDLTRSQNTLTQNSVKMEGRSIWDYRVTKGADTHPN